MTSERVYREKGYSFEIISKEISQEKEFSNSVVSFKFLFKIESFELFDFLYEYALENFIYIYIFSMNL